MANPDLPHRSRIYSDLSGFYDHVFTHVFARRIHQVVDKLSIQPGARILEVGIGTGLSIDAYPRHAEVTGIDLSQEMLDRCAQKMDPERHGHIKLQQMDALDLKFENGHFDYVLAYHVVTVVPDPSKLLDEMIRVCKPDGQIIVINHFRSPRKIVHNVVDLVDPIARKLGWSTKLSLDDVITGEKLEVQNRYKTSPWSLFTVVEARKPNDSHASA